jgi:hypothetical protein
MSAQLRLIVTLDEREPFEVATRLIDHNLWDVTRAKHKWPTAQDAPVTWLGFIAWSAAKRTGAIESMTWEQFLASCESVESADDDDEPVGQADPT